MDQGDRDPNTSFSLLEEGAQFPSSNISLISSKAILMGELPYRDTLGL
jgi:hypothetical protein